MNYTPLVELAAGPPPPAVALERSTAIGRPVRSIVSRTEILVVDDDPVRAEAEIRSRYSRSVVDEIFVVRNSKEALNVLCRLREYEYRYKDRDLRVVLIDPYSGRQDLRSLARRLEGEEAVTHFPIVRAVKGPGGEARFEAVHYHEFEDLLDSTCASCVLFWETYRRAA